MPFALPWPTSLARLAPAERHLAVALVVSVFLHAVLLSIHFKLPEKLDNVREQALDVILVNAKHAEKPVKAQAKAQANLDAGGNIDAPRRAKTPLPPSRESHSGDDLVAARQRVALLEQQQRELLTKRGTEHAIRPQTEPTLDAQQAEISGRDLATAARALVRLEAEIGRSIDEYNQRPKRKFIGARVEEYRFAQYVEDWRQKVERVGNLNYPEAARGKLYGSLILTVAIKNDGSLERVELNRSSGHKVLDEAAQRIVRLAAPFAAFPENIRRDTDIIEITRTWTFTGADQLSTN
ncbi:MAG: energy transducer TonB [Rhodocyclaceae bacterium]|nr:energy transducer TonB [Rhodocyclaceae bacterium]